VSTRGRAPALSFDDVLVEGLAVDGGLYVPETWPVFDRLPDPSRGYAAVVEEVVTPFVTGGVVAEHLGALVHEVYGRFRHPEVAPLREVQPDRHLLELFWGPTLSFKDYAMQLLGAMFELVLARRGRRVLVLGATSGDTGSAAIEALAGLESVGVVILYPDGRVSDIQRRQMTTVDAPNVRAVAVDGTFDDCQDLVKAAFGDLALRRRLSLAAVNSINWARVMAQAAYHVWTAARLGREYVVAVPTGNFGNALAADVARRMGAPIRRLVVANNANHGVADLIATGRLVLSPVVASIAPAMDIQVPSNLERYLFELVARRSEALAGLMEGLRGDGGLVLDEVSHAAMQGLFSAAWFDDARIEDTIRRVHGATGLVIDPHTATGWAAADAHPVPGLPSVVVATAHPAKFPETVAAALGFDPPVPSHVSGLLDRDERITHIEPSLAALVDTLEGLAG
jgi:threonine synthase